MQQVRRMIRGAPSRAVRMTHGNTAVWGQIGRLIFAGSHCACHCHHQEHSVAGLRILSLCCKDCEVNHPLAVVPPDTVFCMN